MKPIKFIQYRVKRVPGYVRNVVCCFLDWIVPKRADAVFLASVHGSKYAGNSRCLFEYLIKERPDLDVRFYLKAPVKDGPAEKVMYPGWKTLCFFLRAKTIFLTHGFDDFAPYEASGRKTAVQLWHGIPLRYTSSISPLRSARTQKTFKKTARRYTFTVAPSKEAAFRFSCCAQNDLRSYLYCGQPRNDALVEGNRKPLPEAAMTALLGAQKVILYAPTARWYGRTPWFEFPDFDLDALNGLLARHNAVLLLRPHQSDVGSVQEFFSDHIRDFSTAVCPDLNDAMPYADVIIADYSSLIYDYLLLDRPVIFFHHDYKEYGEFFSFMFDCPEFWFPGDRPLTAKDFLRALDDALSGEDPWQKQRQLVNQLINAKQTGCSGKQIMEILGI